MLLLGIAAAAAMTCQEVLNLVSVGVPESVVLQTMAAATFTEADTTCLRERGASPAIVAASETGAPPPFAPPLEGEPADPLPALADTPGPVGVAARALAADPVAALRALAPGDDPAVRYLAGRAALALDLPTLATGLLALPAADPLAPSAATLLVDHRGSRPVFIALHGVPEPAGPTPPRVRAAFRLRDALLTLARVPDPQADLAAGLHARATDGELAIPTAYTSALLLARSARPTDPALNLAAERLRGIVAAVDGQDGARVTSARPTELDADRELAVLALAGVAWRTGHFEAAIALFDTIPRTSTRWPRAQLAAAETDALIGHGDRAFARLRPLLDPRAPRRDWRRRARVPPLAAAAFDAPPEDTPLPVLEAWEQVALLVIQPGGCAGPRDGLPRGTIGTYIEAMKTVGARARGWRDALRTGGSPAPMADALTTPWTRWADARSAAVDAEAARLRTLDPRWADALAPIPLTARQAADQAHAEARVAAARRADELATQAEIVRFEFGTICDRW